MTSSDYLGLAEANVEIVRQYGIESDHRRLWLLVVSGRIPAERRRGRWYVRATDLPRIAELLGPAPAHATSASPRKARSRTAAASV